MRRVRRLSCKLPLECCLDSIGFLRASYSRGVHGGIAGPPISSVKGMTKARPIGVKSLAMHVAVAQVPGYGGRRRISNDKSACGRGPVGFNLKRDHSREALLYRPIVTGVRDRTQVISNESIGRYQNRYTGPICARVPKL